MNLQIAINQPMQLVLQGTSNATSQAVQLVPQHLQIAINQPLELVLQAAPAALQLAQTCAQGLPGPQGPAGPVGPAGPAGAGTALVGPEFTYVGGNLARVDYDDGSYKLFTYSGGALTQIDYIKGGVTQRKTFNYVAGVLASIDEITF